MAGNLIKKWLGDPLFHFLLIGAGIFVVVGIFVQPEEAAQVIVVDDQIRAGLTRKFELSTGRKPQDADLAAMIEAWVQEEALFREGVSLGFGDSDGFVRERIIALVRGSIKNAVALPISNPASEELKRYFESHRERYLQHPRFDLEHAIIRDSGPEGRQAAAALLASLQGGQSTTESGHRFLTTNGRTAQQLATIFGDDFTSRLQGLAAGTWHALESRRGWHVLRIDKIHEGRDPTFEEAASRVLDDWRLDQARELTGSQLRAILSRYRVVGDDSTG